MAELSRCPSMASLPTDAYRGGAQSCCVQSSSVPTYVLFLQVTLTTSIPARGGDRVSWGWCHCSASHPSPGIGAKVDPTSRPAGGRVQL